MAVEYRIFNIVKTGTDLMSARVPRVQPSATAHFGDHLSWMVGADMWCIDPVSGNPLSYEGKTIEQVLEEWLSTRPHALMPVALEDTSGECWREGNLTKQAQRFKELRAFTGSDAAAMILFTEEAAAYGVKPGSTEKGEKIVKGADKKSAGSSSNPWDQEHWRGGDETARQAKMQSIIRNSTAMARTMAKSAGRKIDGSPLGK